MSRWNILKKQKKENKKETNELDINETQTCNDEDIIEDKETKVEISNAAHHEVLYSRGTAPREEIDGDKKSMNQWNRKSWETPSTIEKNVDDINKVTIETPKPITPSDVDEKVDKLLTKHKKK